MTTSTSQAGAGEGAGAGSGAGESPEGVVRASIEPGMIDGPSRPVGMTLDEFRCVASQVAAAAAVLHVDYVCATTNTMVACWIMPERRG